MDGKTDEDVGGPMRQENTTARYGKEAQHGCSASYSVRDGDRADDYVPREETRGDGDEDV